MRFLWVLLFALTDAKSIDQIMPESHEVIKLVSNGEIYNPNEYPYVVCITYYHSPTKMDICTGTLISEYYVLTAGHCTYDKSVDKITVYHGVCDASNEQRRNVSICYQHEQFDELLLTSDISLLKLEEPFENVSEFVDFKSTDPSNFENDKALSCIVIGFGRTQNPSFKSGSQGHIAHVNTKHGQNACAMNNDYWEELLCLVPSKYTICHGDSGGPLICDGVQYGVASAGYNRINGGIATECGSSDVQNVHVFVHHYRDWIFDRIGLTAEDNVPVTRPFNLFIVLAYSYVVNYHDTIPQL